jgi:TonB-linked SusC/RagA family outer membrane protein
MRKLFMLMACVLSIALTAGAQISRVTGQVLSAEDNEPILGASVRVKGQQTGAVTDLDGRFVLSGLTAKDKELEVSFVGCETQFVKVAPEITVYLKAQQETMEELIVVAFGKQKRESFTGSASVVNSAQLSLQQTANPIEALNGRVSGMQMTDANGLSDDPTIRVRGISSLNAGNSPLIVVDGMPYNGYLNDLNTADIENITVLKDAASNALYGARGANGVILITTKSGQRGATKVSLEAKWGANTNGRVEYNTIDNPGEYYEAAYLGYKNYYMGLGQTASQAHVSANNILTAPYTSGGLGYNVYNVPENQYLIGTNGKLNPQATLGNRVAYNNQIYTLYPDDWLKEGTRNGFRQEYNLSLTGGNDQFRTFASLGYLNEEGLSYGSDLKRYTARLKTEYQAYKWLRIGANALYNHKVSNDLSSVFGVAYTIAPIYPLYIRDGEGNILTDARGLRYDYGETDNAGLQRPCDKNQNSVQYDRLEVSKNVSNAFNINGFATADIYDGLSLTVNGNVYITENRVTSAADPYYGYYATINGEVSTYHYRTTDSNFQQLLNYNKQFGRHNVSGLLGHEYSRNTVTTLGATRSNIAMFTENQELAGAIVDKSMTGYKSLYNVEGYFLRAQYDYDSKYFGSFSFRRDGSSRFDPDHRWGNFWSLGGAYIISREEWFPKSKWIDVLKVKASYGEQGNDNIGNYRYTDTYTISNSNDNVAYVFSTKGNKNITWETVGALNVGLEFELFKSRLRGSVEYYNRKTTDMLMWFSAPYSIGYGGYYSNVGDMSNSGVEIELSADIVKTRNFSWSVDANMAWQRNRVTYLPEDNKLYEVEGYNGFENGNFFVGEGLPVNTWYLKRYAGVNENGVGMFYKTAEDGTLTTTTSYDSADYYLCGSALPDVFGGFSTTFHIYDFDIAANFNYSIGGKKYDSGYQALMTPAYSTLTGGAWHRDIYNAWSETNQDSDIPLWSYALSYPDGNNSSDRWLTSASYLALKNITIGYTLPRKWTNKLKMDRLRVYVTGQNLYYWSARKGFDPRSSDTVGSYGDYSPIRSFTGGLTVNF